MSNSADASKSRRSKRVTLRDIAEVAGVHVMTVSDALNDTRNVAPATRARIKAIAREMNYVPNFAARALVTGRSGMIAVISGAMNEPYYANMVHVLEKYLMADEYQLLLLRTQREVQHLVNSAGAAAVDGAIAIGTLWSKSFATARRCRAFRWARWRTNFSITLSSI